MIDQWTLANVNALKRHVPEIEEIIKNVDSLPFQEDPPFDLQGAEVVCKEGVSCSFYEKVRPWLDAKEGRRLFWIEQSPERLAQLIQEELALPLLTDRRTRIFYVQTRVQGEFVAKKIGWLSAFKKLIILGTEWKEEIEKIQQAAQLIASDAADFGVVVARHLKANFRSQIRSFAALKGTMKNVPVIIVGAGPSLEQNGSLLKAFEDKALLIAAGNAIKTMKIRPHLAAAVDPHEPLERTRYFDVPLCLQGRTHPKTRKSAQGEIFYIPDSHYAFEAWLTESEPLNGGWTVGNSAISMAIELGCNPILLIGMDYCYRGKQKYAGKQAQSDTSSLIKSVDSSGREVFTQADWLMAIRWVEEIAAAHPEIAFYNASSEGMRIGAPVTPLSLTTFTSAESNIAERWKTAMQKAPWIEVKKDRLNLWKESLMRCKSKESESIHDSPLEENIALDLLLEPLWRIWSPMFERELMSDLHPIPMAEKLAIQKKLFFNQVIEEHLSAL